MDGYDRSSVTVVGPGRVGEAVVILERAALALFGAAVATGDDRARRLAEITVMAIASHCPRGGHSAGADVMRARTDAGIS